MCNQGVIECHLDLSSFILYVNYRFCEGLMKLNGVVDICVEEYLTTPTQLFRYFLIIHVWRVATHQCIYIANSVSATRTYLLQEPICLHLEFFQSSTLQDFFQIPCNRAANKLLRIVTKVKFKTASIRMDCKKRTPNYEINSTFFLS